MAKKKDPWPPYKAYKFRGDDRIKGQGMDIWFGHVADCAKCAANFMSMAWEAGFKAGRKR